MSQDVPLRLLIPGPVSVHPDVLAAMARPVLPHYGPVFRDLFKETLGLLRELFSTSGDVYLMAGSGTAAIDACIGSALRSGETIIVGSNGFFGERLIQVASAYGLDVIPVRGAEGCPLEPGALLPVIEEHPEARALAVVHLETSTTVINPLAEIGELLRGRNLLYIVDAVSSLGGVQIDMDQWGIDLCAASTQKCLGAPPGLAPVAISPHAWKMIDRSGDNPHGWYSDLRTWRKYFVEWGDWHPTPVTMPTSIVTALHTALLQLKAEGAGNRLERYRQLALQLRAGLEKLGMQLYTSEEYLNPVLTAAYMPAGIPSGRLISFLETQHHIKISSGLGPLKERLIRVGHMSPVITAQDIDDVLAGIADFLQLHTKVGENHLETVR